MRDFLRRFTGHFLPGHDNAYRPHLLRKSWLLFFLSVILTSEGLYIASLMAGQSAQNFLSAVVPGEVIALTNVERTNVGDNAVIENAQLDSAAQAKANDMAQKGYFSHVGPDGTQPWAWISGAGYAYRYAGENLAVRFDESSDVVNAWMASPTHKANIVKPVYTEIGIGVAQGTYEGSPATFVVQYFGTPKESDETSVAAATPAQEPSAVKASPAQAQVAGAETPDTPAPETPSSTPPVVSTPTATTQTPSEGSSEVRSEVQSFIRANEASQHSISWVLGGIATLVLLVVFLAVVVHIEIQPAQLVMGGAFVGVVALSFLALNHSFLSDTFGNSQSASVVGSTYRSILVGDGASVELP